MGTCYTQNILGHVLEIADQLDVVLNSRLGERPVIAGKECPRFGFGIWRHNQSLRMRVPDSGLEILYLPSPDAVDGSPHDLVLCAHFTPDAQERAAQDGAARFLKFGQTVVHIIKVVIEPFERWNCWRKKSIHVRLVLVPFRFQCSGGELGLRLEEIIKASLFCAGALADRVHRSGAVAVFPHQIQRRVGQALLHVTYSWHTSRLASLDRPVNYFVQLFFPPQMRLSLNSSAYCSANSAGCPPVCQNKIVSFVLKNPVRIKSIIPAAARPV